jgi:VanZ family protein
MVIFLILASLQFLHLFHSNNIKKTAFITISFGIAYGIFLELVQEFFVESRIGDLSDVVANTIGTLAGTLLMFLILKNNHKISTYFIDKTTD